MPDESGSASRFSREPIPPLPVCTALEHAGKISPLSGVCPVQGFLRFPYPRPRFAFAGASVLSEAAGFFDCARLSFKAAIRSMTGASFFGFSTS